MATKMASKSARNATPDLTQAAVINAALDLAAERGWAGVTLTALAERLDVDLATLRTQIDSRADLIAVWSRTIDTRTLAAAPSTGSARDRVFDLLMERFECLNEQRAGTLAVLRGLTFDPQGASAGLRALTRAMGWTLAAAGLEAYGPRGGLRVAALTGLYLHTLRTWKSDDSADLSATMAALDKNLGRAFAMGARFGFGEGHDHE